MLDALKFVKGAVAKRDFQPELQHFRIDKGRIKSYNGRIALSAPLDIDITASPKAIPFTKAIERCETTVAMSVTPSGLLSIRSGKFKVRVECYGMGEDEEDYKESHDSILDRIEPEGEPISFPISMLDALRKLEPFISNDASRPWANGILLRGESAYATNNIVVVEYWLGAPVPEVNIPAQAVQELIRINKDPDRLAIGENSITFFYEGDRWMRAQLLSTDWPDLSRVLDRDGVLKPLPEGLFAAVEHLRPFVDDSGRIFFRQGMVATTLDDRQGASLEVEGVPEKGAFHWEHLLSLNGVAKTIDFSVHPEPCPFLGERIRGVILGMVDQ